MANQGRRGAGMPRLPQNGAEAFVRGGGAEPVLAIAGVEVWVLEPLQRIRLYASGPAGTLIVKSRHPKTGLLLLTLAGGQEYCPRAMSE